jgi:hypothetical protein
MSTQQTNSLRMQISQIRRMPSREIHAHDRRGLVTQRIIRDLQKNGTFFNTPEGHFYFRKSETPRLFPIGANLALTAFISEQYGINPAEECEFKHVLKGLEIEAELRGEKVQVHRASHYDPKTRRLYVSRFNGTVCRLDGEHITQIPNGTDGVFFWDDPSWQAFDILPVVQSGLVERLIVRSANFCNTAGLTSFEQGWVFHAWCLAQFFGSLHPTKPLLLICGEKGGGKTLCLRKWLKLLFGEGADVTGLERGKQDGFVAAVCSSSIAVFDNVDEHIGWLPDHLAQIATGIKFKRRKYYTTNEMVEFQPQCFVALTSRTPKFINGRDDVLDRTLVLQTSRRKQFSPENDQLRKIAVNRNALWSELLRHLNLIVAYRKNDRMAAENVDFRMADFASFAMAVGRVAGQGDMARSILQKLDSARSNLLLSDEPISACLEKWLEEPGNHGRKTSSGELNTELGEVAKRENILWPYQNAYGVGQRLAHITTNLKERFEVEVEKDSSNQAWYRFSPRLNR